MACLGQHLTVDMYGCKFEKLNDLEFIKEAIYAAAKEANMTLLNISHHMFESDGLTAMALLTESHMIIHTNPKLGYAAIDIFTLSKTCQPDKAVSTLKRFLKPDKTKTTRIMRGDFGSQKDMKPRVRISIAPLRRVKNTGVRVWRFLGRSN